MEIMTYRNDAILTLMNWRMMSHSSITTTVHCSCWLLKLQGSTEHCYKKCKQTNKQYVHKQTNKQKCKQTNKLYVAGFNLNHTTSPIIEYSPYNMDIMKYGNNDIGK